MSSTVCQGLRPCLDPQIVEPCVLRHDLSPLESNSSQSRNENNNAKSYSWSFIQPLSNNSQNCQEFTDNERVYVHPLSKRSTSTLSKKSLEMCTESLGSETGSDTSEISDDFPSLTPLEIGNSHSMERSKCREFARKLIPSRSFPPPLISIRGPDSVQLRPHREGGRLVIKAVRVSSHNGYFEAERADGRLRLCLVNNNSLNCDNGVDEDNFDDDGGGDVHDDEWVESRSGNSENVGCEIGIEEIQRPSRCKERWWEWEQRDVQLGAIS